MQLFHHFAERLPTLCSPVKPFPVKSPRVALKNEKLASELGIPLSHLDDEALFKQLFNEDYTPSLNSVAQKYGGHQFGQWNPQLGDGRGLLLGEIKTPTGNLVDLHLKGAGQTPYSRHADGRAVLRSTIREYLASEALHQLNIPTSRALCLIASEEPVRREVVESGAMLIRTCPSHIRFGHFEYFFHSKQFDKLDQLFSYCFEFYFQACQKASNPYLAMLTEVCQNTGKMIAYWQAYGFNHGVMNTDNMSIHGITFDYGPYAFLDDFIPNYICNKSDHSGRYAFDQQPSIALWNLNALAHAFSDKLSMDELKQALSTFEPAFLSQYQKLIQQRFGFSATKTEEMSKCINQFMQLVRDEFADYNLSFLHITEHLMDIINGNTQAFSSHFEQKESFSNWAVTYKKVLTALENDITQVQQNMRSVNPRYVLRNHHMQEAILRAENGDFSYCENLFSAISTPFQRQETLEIFMQAPSANEKGMSLSCSS